ncbi:MAG: PAS domain-containing protein [Candidatus Brocadiaceae bacterium]|nr:PAS domain-containing protein [Candidatus Brocadiaceae bacterium]
MCPEAMAECATTEQGPSAGGRSRPALILPMLAGLTLLAGLHAAGRYNYLLFHTLAEGFAIAVACAVFMLAWNARHILENACLLLLGVAYLFVAGLDLIHTLAYRGMAIFPDQGANPATQLWIAARGLEAGSLLLAPLVLNVRLRPRLVLLAYAVVAGSLLVLVVRGVFPECFAEGVGPTPFKIAAEYVICAVLAGTAVLLHRRRDAFDPGVRRLLVASILVTIVSEISFTLYQDPYGFFNQVGHFLKIVSFYLIYRAVIVTGMSRPYDLMYRRLHESEERYRRLFDSMAEGFVLQEMADGEQGDARECRFLEVNPAFERLMGLRAADVIGRRMQDVLPGAAQDWLQICRVVAETGRPAHVESYFSNLDRWFELYAYRPAPDQYAIIFSEISRRKRAEAELLDLNASLERRVAERTAEVREQADRLRALASRLRRVERDERERLARVLHDHVQQLLAAARMQAAWIKDDRRPERVRATAQMITDILQEAIDACRSLAVDLSPPVLREDGLAAALRWLADRMQEQHQLTVRLGGECDAEPATHDVRALLFECVRELLFNAVKHGGVAEAEVSLALAPDGCIRVCVCDQGKGFDLDEVRRRGSDQMTFGLFSIQERLAHVGGTTEIRTAPGNGTRIMLSVPARDTARPVRGGAGGTSASASQ